MKIVVITDRVNRARRCFSLVTQILEKKKARVVVLYLARAGRNRSKRIQEAAYASVGKNKVVKNFKFVRIISFKPNFLANLINRESADLLVINSQDFIKNVSFRADSELSQLIHSVALATFVVKRTTKDLSHFLLILEVAARERVVVKKAASLAKLLRAQVTLLHVEPQVPKMYTGLKKMQESLPAFFRSKTATSKQLKRVVELFVKMGINSTIILRHGDNVAGEFVAESVRGKYDLVVIGNNHDPSVIDRLLEEDLVLKIIEDVEQPVLVIPDK